MVSKIPKSFSKIPTIEALLSGDSAHNQAQAWRPAGRRFRERVVGARAILELHAEDGAARRRILATGSTRAGTSRPALPPSSGTSPPIDPNTTLCRQ